MKIYQINYFVYGDPCVAIVAANNEADAITLTGQRYDEEDQFNVDTIAERNTDLPSVLYSHFRI